MWDPLYKQDIILRLSYKGTEFKIDHYGGGHFQQFMAFMNKAHIDILVLAFGDY